MRPTRLGAAAVAAASLTLAACAKDSVPSPTGTEVVLLGNVATQGTTGNGMPSGAHYQFNMIGVSNPKTANMTDSQRRSIFVSLTGKTSVWLSEGPFDVLDGNGTDNNGAAFQLPNPDPENTGTTRYSVWVRALGTPGGSARMTSCATDPLSTEVYCSADTITVARSTGKPKADNVSRDLLYVYADLDGDLVLERYPLFSTALQNYYWEYDNAGLRNAQFRFYEVPTTVQ